MFHTIVLKFDIWYHLILLDGFGHFGGPGRSHICSRNAWASEIRRVEKGRKLKSIWHTLAFLMVLREMAWYDIALSNRCMTPLIMVDWETGTESEQFTPSIGVTHLFGPPYLRLEALSCDGGEAKRKPGSLVPSLGRIIAMNCWSVDQTGIPVVYLCVFNLLNYIKF